ncbi:MAG: PAS domain-containing protein [Alphaproteobacteria bacterium]|nr:PAS domain-containing protein [Alphaproteobacteria bacterium]
MTEGLPTVLDLKARVGSAVIGEVFAYWATFFEKGSLPAFEDVEPWKIKRALPYVWIWRRDQADDRFYCRICGEQVNYILGRNISGKAADEVLPADMAAEAQARWRRLIDERLAHHLVGCVYNFADQQVMGERVILPLAPSRNDRGGVLGVTDADQTRLRLVSPVDPSKFVGMGIGERRDYDADPAHRGAAQP